MQQSHDIGTNVGTKFRPLSEHTLKEPCQYFHAISLADYQNLHEQEIQFLDSLTWNISMELPWYIV